LISNLNPVVARWARLVALSTGLLVAITRASVALHELLGHALVGAALGLGVTDVRVSLFGGGEVHVAGEPEGAAAFAFAMSGIFVNLLLMAACLAGARRARGPAVRYALALGAVVNAAGATHYTALGGYHAFGDPAAWPWLAWPGLAALVVLMPLTLRTWARALAGLTGRPLVAGLAVAVALGTLAAYGGAMQIEAALTAEQTQFRALAADEAEHDRAVATERAERARQWEREHPGEPPPDHLLDVRPDEVPRPFPLTVVVLGADVALFALVLWRVRSRGGPPTGPHEALPWGRALLAAALALLLCATVL
jgi:hypothetical protein